MTPAERALKEAEVVFRGCGCRILVRAGGDRVLLSYCEQHAHGRVGRDWPGDTDW